LRLCAIHQAVSGESGFTAVKAIQGTNLGFFPILNIKGAGNRHSVTLFLKIFSFFVVLSGQQSGFAESALKILYHCTTRRHLLLKAT